MATKFFKNVTVLSALALFGMSFAVADIAGSKHDMGEYAINANGTPKTLPTAGGDCRWCHAPHNTSNTVPLWDRFNDPQTWQPYTSNTMDVAAPDPAGVSLACMSCHDGTTAIDSFGLTTGTGDDMTQLVTSAELGDNEAILGTDLRNDHPVSMAMVTTSEFNSIASVNTAGLPTYGGTDTVECASCHDPHEIDLVAAPAPLTYGLRKNDAALCTTCHVK